jgi:hypothetical protein
MTLKEELIQELEHLSESDLLKVLEYVRGELSRSTSEGATATESFGDDPVWQAYLASAQEREEVYRRLANS